MKKLLVLLLLNVLPVFSQVQNIIGYVYDGVENKPLEGAYVYLDGTTFSASTNDKGYFRISVPQKYNSALVVSYIGFETLRIQDPYQYKKPFKVLLREDNIQLEEVVISNKTPFTRRQMMRVFREQFLGRTANGSSCKIENEDDIKLYYDISKNILRAKCSVPVRVINKKLEYKLAFQIIDFQVVYKKESLNDFDMTRSSYAGTTSFTDVSANHSADKKRRDAYLGSTTHFMRTLAAGTWQQERFELYVNRFATDPHEYLTVTDSLDYKKVQLNDISAVKAMGVAPPRLTLKDQDRSKYARLEMGILYDRRLQTGIFFDEGRFYIDHTGLFSPITELLFNGYMGTLKVGDLLPTDYTP